MKTYRPGNPAPYGLYASIRPPDVRFVGAEGEALAGLDDVGYVRLPTVLAFAVAPLLGGLFVIAFPLLTVAATAYGLSRLLVGRARTTAEKNAWLANSNYAPTMAYLNRGEKRAGENEADGHEESKELSDLEKEVAARRDAEKAPPPADEDRPGS